MNLRLLLPCLAAALAAAGCVHVKTDPIEVKPIHITVDVNVKVDLDLSADGLSSPVIALYDFDAKGAIVMPDVVNQTMNDGNQFNIDQVQQPGR